MNPQKRLTLPLAPVLDWRLPITVAALVICVVMPFCIWLGLINPGLFHAFMVPWPATWAKVGAATCTCCLFIIPLSWVLASGTLDLFAFFLAQNGLLIAGYFFIGVTAWRIQPVAHDIMRAASLVVVVNCLGFTVLFCAMGLTYLATSIARMRMPPLYSSPEDYDRRFTTLLRMAGLGVASVLALPMVHHGTFPLLSHDPVAARALIESTDVDRSLYNAGTALMPFIVGGLLLLIVHNPRRLFGMDGVTAGAAALMQLLSSNRFPLAIAFFVTVTLMTMEKKWPRPLLLVAFFTFMFLLTGLSGLTGMLRQDRSALSQGNVVTGSLQEAFYGDNLIDSRDAAWTYSQWDFKPLMGRTYLGGLVAMLPSGIFPLKKQYHLGLTAIRIVGWDPDKHFGLRITFFGESFLNFGPAGVVALGTIMGCLFGTTLKMVRLASAKKPPCLHYNLKIVILMQMCMPLANTSDAFTFWTMGAFLFLQWMFVDLAVRRWDAPRRYREIGISKAYAQGRA